MKKFYFVMLFIFVASIGMGAVEVTDVLTNEFTGIEGQTTYTDFGPTEAASGAQYVGNCAKHTYNGVVSIQMRASGSNSGIVSSVSGGKVKRVVVEWGTNTEVGRTLNIFGKNTAYSSGLDLEEEVTQGDKLGTIVCGTSTSLEITGDYEYIGLRSDYGAMYLLSISITWENGKEQTQMVAPSLSLESGTYYEAQTVVLSGEGDLHWTVNGVEQAELEYTMEDAGTYSVEAWATDPDGTLSESEHVVKTYEIAPTITDCYTLVENISTLTEGSQIIFVGSNSKSTQFGVMGAQNGDYRNAVVIALNGNQTKYFSQDAAIFTVGKTDDGYFTFQNIDGYLAAKTSAKSKIESVASISDEAKWTVSITDGTTSITAKSHFAEYPYLLYNASSPRFTMYKSTSVGLIGIYCKMGTTGIDSVIEDTTAPVEYYNLQGIRIDGDLLPGLYIRRQGNNTTKVVVK